MPILYNRTREEMRTSIGYNLMGGRFIRSTTTRAGGDANSVIDRNRLFGGNDRYNGHWVYALSGTNDGEIRRATDFEQGTLGTDAAASHDLTLATGFGATVPITMTYEIWEPQFPPEWINELINQALLETAGRAYDPEEDESLHTGHDVTRYLIPAALDAVNEVWYRESFNGVQLHAFDRVYDERTNANVTQLVDSQDYKRGAASLRLTIAAGLAAGDHVSDSITSVNLAGYTHLEGWIKSNLALAASDWAIRLDNAATQGDSTDLEIITLPATVADTWTWVRVALANPRLDTAIVSVGLEMNVDIGAHAIWFDDFWAVTPETSVWRKLHPSSWYIDKEGTFLYLTDSAESASGYSLLKLKGGGAPVLLTADSTTSEASAWWVICRATELAFQGAIGPHGSNERYQAQAIIWGDRAKQAYKGLNRIRGARSRA